MRLFARGQADALGLSPSYVGQWRRADFIRLHPLDAWREVLRQIRSKSPARYFGWLSLFAALLLLGACASSQIVDHGFAFDVISDSPDVELLDYRYGDSKLPGAANPEALRAGGKAPQRINIHGPMRRGDVLYVKWRLKNTGRVLEDTVDLGSRMPTDISGHKIYFEIKGAQLYVYLIPPESQKRAVEKPAIGPRLYRDLAVRIVYPDASKR